MHLHLYRPTLWWSGEAVRLLDAASTLTAFDEALLLRLKRATLIPQPNLSGDSMSDDQSSALQLVTPPATEPVTLDQAKAFLRIDNTADDDAVTRAITAARKYAEIHLHQLLLPQTWDYSLANPCATTIALPAGPAKTITTITLTSELGTVKTVDPATYHLSVDGFSVIFTGVPQGEVLKIEFTAGAYATAADIPAPIVQGILHHIATMVENRDGTAALPVQAANCFQLFRRIRL